MNVFRENKIVNSVLGFVIGLIVLALMLPIALSQWINENSWLDSSGSYVFSSDSSLESLFVLFFILIIGLGFYQLFKKSK